MLDHGFEPPGPAVVEAAAKPPRRPSKAKGRSLSICGPNWGTTRQTAHRRREDRDSQFVSGRGSTRLQGVRRCPMVEFLYEAAACPRRPTQGGRMTTSETPTDNGVNVQALLDARTALTDAPEGAQFTWRASNQWVRGTHSQSVITGFFGLGGEQSHRSTWSFDADHPEVFASEDIGP